MSCLVVQRVVLFGFFVEADVNIEQGADTAFFDVVFVAPEFVCDDKFAELRAPVAKVIYADRAVAQEVERAIKRRADDRRHKMADVERLCDVDGRIVDADGFARADVGRAVLVAFRGDFVQNYFVVRAFVKVKVEISVFRLDLIDKFRKRRKIKESVGAFFRLGLTDVVKKFFKRLSE